MFAVGAWQDPPVDAFPVGTAQYPDRSASPFVAVPVSTNMVARLHDLGIKHEKQLSLPKRGWPKNGAAIHLCLN